MRAFQRGAPVRILLPAFTGTGDLFWYVRADSPIKTIKDATANHTIAYSTSGYVVNLFHQHHAAVADDVPAVERRLHNAASHPPKPH